MLDFSDTQVAEHVKVISQAERLRALGLDPPAGATTMVGGLSTEADVPLAGR